MGRHHQDGSRTPPRGGRIHPQAPSIVAMWRIWWPQGSPLQVGRSCRGPHWKLQPLWMKNRTSPGRGGKQSRHVESSFLNVVLPTLSDPDIALWKSQGGPLASAPFVSFPTRLCHMFGTAGSEGVVFPSFASPTPLHSSCLPVRPSSRRLATTGRRVLWQEFSGAEGFLWKLQRQESAVKQVGEFAQTFLFEIWTWAWSTSSTPGGLRWWWMGCLFSKELKLPWTRRSSVR